MIPGVIAGSYRASFNPATISPLAWYDASDTSTLTVSSNKVSQWNDKGSNGYNLTQGTSANQPKSGLTTRNGLNVVDFDGSGWMEGSTASNWTSLHTTDKGLWALAFNNTKAGNGWIFSTRSSTGNGGGSAELNADNRSSAAKIIVASLNGSGQYVCENVKSSAYTNGTFTYMTFINDFGNATASNRSEIYLEQGTANKANAETATAGTTAPQVPLNLGRIAGFNITMEGSICELILVTGANATETNRTKLRDYLKSKWGF